MKQTPPQNIYLDEFFSHLPTERAAKIKRQAKSFLIVLTNTRGQILRTGTGHAERRRCISADGSWSHRWDSSLIENIDLSWTTKFGSELNIDAGFFATHASNPKAETPIWHATSDSTPSKQKKPIESRDTASGRSHWHVDGVMQ
ncbi:hypothetical protein Q7P37_011507 [Cladosporium fusiforme]